MAPKPEMIPYEDLKRCLEYLLVKNENNIQYCDRVYIAKAPELKFSPYDPKAAYEPVAYTEKQYTIRDILFTLSVVAQQNLQQQALNSTDWAMSMLAQNHEHELKSVADAEYQRGYEQGRSEFVQSVEAKRRAQNVAQEKKKRLRLDID